MRFACWLCAATMMTGCSSGSTWLLVELERGSDVPTEVASVEFQLTLTEGVAAPGDMASKNDLGPLDFTVKPGDMTVPTPTTQTAVVTLDNVKLPTSVSFNIAKGEGQCAVTAIARDGGGVEIRRAMGTVTVARGKTVKLALTLGTAAPPDLAGVDYAGADLAGVDLVAPPGPDMAQPPADMVAQLASLQILPAMRNYGSVLTGQMTSEQQYTVKNVGNAQSGTLTASLSNTDFSVGTDLCSSLKLNPGESCTVGVLFTPKAPAGDKSSTLTVSDGLATGTAMATGMGIAPGALTISPMNHTFADTAKGASSSDTASFTITNNGGVDTAVVSATIESTNDTADFTLQTNTCSTVIAKNGGTCQVDVRFVPKTKGDKFASIKVSDGTVAVVAPVNGKALVAVLEMVAYRGDSDFGAVGCGDSYLSVQVTNTGNAPTGQLVFSLTGGDTSGFLLDTSGNYCVNDNGAFYSSSYYCVTNASTYQVSVPPCSTTQVLAGGAKCQRVIYVSNACSWSAGSSHMATVNVTASPGGTPTPITFTASRP